MAGNANSGRRDGTRNEDGSFAPAKPKKPQWTREAPKLTDMDSNLAFTEWTREQVIEGVITTKDGDALMKIANQHEKGLKTKHLLHEIDELRAMVGKAESIEDIRKQNLLKNRHSAGTTSQLGRVKRVPQN